MLYLTAHSGLDFSKSEAQLIAGSYLTYLYLITAIGGIIADRLIGYQRAVLIGGSIIVLGHICLTSSFLFAPLFFIGLGCISTGTGLFKANVSVMVGMLYDEEKQYLRSSGFSIFYAGINIGAAIATFLVGYVGEVYGWHYGFSLAAFGMISGLITFKIGCRYMPKSSNVLNPVMNKKIVLFLPFKLWHLVIVAALITVALFALLIPDPQYSKLVIGISSLILLVYLSKLWFRMRGVDRKRVVMILIMSIFMLLFWSFNDQILLSLPLFINKFVNHQFIGLHWETTSIMGCYSLLIMVINPFFAYYVQKFSSKKSGVAADQTKFAISLVMEAIAFAILGLAAIYVGRTALIGMYWILLFQFFLVFGELFISPIGLSLVTRLAPEELRATMMGTWWTISAYAGFIGGIIGTFTVRPYTKTAANVLFAHTYFTIGILAFIAAVVLFVLLPLLKRASENTI